MDTEMQRGMLPGAMALSAKFVPVVQRVSQKTLEAVKDFVADPKALSEKASMERSNCSFIHCMLFSCMHACVPVLLLPVLSKSTCQLLLPDMSKRKSSVW